MRGANLTRMAPKKTRRASRSEGAAKATKRAPAKRKSAAKHPHATRVLHRELARVAIAASRQAHSPYSRIRVGAALLTDDGLVSTGANVENASYGLTICAERVALVKAVSEGARKFTTIAIASNTRRALTPCGACRQSLVEFAPDLRVLLVGRRGIEREFTLAELLPAAFEPRDLR